MDDLSRFDTLAETHAALKASIVNWVKRAEGTYEGPNGWKGCPLCLLFNYPGLAEQANCAGCPVMGHTGRRYCEGTPYDKWESASWKNLPAIARDEVDFLRTLLPEGETVP